MKRQYIVFYKYTLWKLTLGTLHVWEVANWKIVPWEVTLGKRPLGKYLRRYYRCSTVEFTCDDGTCIPLVNRCNITPDCPDNSDEVGCRSIIREGIIV